MIKLNRSGIRKSLYTAAQWTWGLPQTLIGAGLYMKHRKYRHFGYQGACVTAWDRNDGVSLGKFIFVPAGSDLGNSDHDEIAPHEITSKRDRFLLSHEYGHTLQSLILGPAYLLLVGAPSIVWNRSGYFARRRKETGRSYYSAIFERTASELGEKAAARREAR